MTEARVTGLVRGQQIEGTAVVELHPDALLLTWRGATPWRLAFDGLDGVTHTATSCTLYLSGHDVLELSGDDSIRALALQIEGQACTIPELTRGLRSLGSLRGAPGTAHDAWFAPLLTARRAVEGITDPARQVMVLDANTLGASMNDAIAGIAAVLAPNDAAVRRATEAALEEDAEAMFAALTRLALAADSLRGAAPDTRIGEWRRWVNALRDVYAAADEGWQRASEIAAR